MGESMTVSMQRLFVTALSVAMVFVLVGGCDRDESASAPAPSSPAPGSASTPANDDRAGDGASADAADTSDAPPAATPTNTIPTPDVPLPKSIQGEAMKGGFVLFSAAEKPKPLGEFYKKELEAKGWKLGRNHAAPHALTTLTGVIQEYTKGNEVLTVSLNEQIADGDLSIALVMDIPLPPNTTQVIATGLNTLIEVPESPEAVLAWFGKELPARGWTAGQQSDVGGGSKKAEFKKGGRNLSVMVRGASGGKPGTSAQLMHLAFGE
jgi:hypothetical protein